jgi:hypothetical protein
MCNCLTLNVDSINSELTISGTLNGKNTYSDGTYTVSWNGSRWEVYEGTNECEAIRCTFDYEGETYVYEGFITGISNGKNTYGFNEVIPSPGGDVAQGFDVGWDGVRWVCSPLVNSSGGGNYNYTDNLIPAFDTWIYGAGPLVSNINTELIYKTCECVRFNFEYNSINYDLHLNKYGILLGENWYILSTNTYSSEVFFTELGWVFRFSIDGFSTQYISNNLISNNWVFQDSGEFEVLNLSSNICNLIGTNTSNTVCPLGIFIPITVTNVNITECFNENDIQPLIQLTEQLYPTGRGFNIHIGSFIRKMHLALNRSESRLNDNTLDILNGILPDNDSFTVEDATLWEQRLGLITNDAVSLSNRKLAIIRKLNYPGTIVARQSGGFIESQLRLAGFDVYVHENPDLISIENLLYSISNVSVSGLSNSGSFNAGNIFTQFSALFDYLNSGSFNAGSSNSGQVYYKGKVANHINENLDATFFHQNNWIKTFFVGGENLGEFATVPIARKDEFRQLILRLKPTETVAYLLIDFT